MTSFLTTGGIRGHNKNMISKFFPRSHNMGIKKALFEKIGGFGPLRHGQDIELSNRMMSENAEIKLIESAIVYHRRRTTLSKFFRQVFNWGIARVNLAKIDRNMLQLVHFLPSMLQHLLFQFLEHLLPQYSFLDIYLFFNSFMICVYGFENT